MGRFGAARQWEVKALQAPRWIMSGFCGGFVGMEAYLEDSKWLVQGVG